MGLTERHWFEDEEPELTERQLEDAVREQKDAYKRGYQKGYWDRDKEIVRCKDCIFWNENLGEYCEKRNSYPGRNWYCPDGEKQKGR